MSFLMSKIASYVYYVFYLIGGMLSYSFTGGSFISFKPIGSTAFTISVALLLKITSLLMVLYSYSNSFMFFSLVPIRRISLSA